MWRSSFILSPPISLLPFYPLRSFCLSFSLYRVGWYFAVCEDCRFHVVVGLVVFLASLCLQWVFSIDGQRCMWCCLGAGGIVVLRNVECRGGMEGFEWQPVSTTLRSVYSGSWIVDMLEIVKASNQSDERYMFEYQLFIGTKFNVQILKCFVASSDVLWIPV